MGAGCDSKHHRSCWHKIRMEELYGNLSNSNASGHEVYLGTGFTAFSIAASMVLAVIFVLDGLIAIMLLLSTSVAVPVRVLLTNLLLASLISVAISLFSLLNSVALALADTTKPSLPLCRFIIWVFSVTLEARLLGLTAFSVTVLKMVMGTMRKIGAKWLILSLLATWMIALLTGIDNIVPPIYGVQYVGGVACFPTEGYPQYVTLGLIYFVSWTVIACFVPLLVCICIPLAALCYIKRHTISEEAQYKKAMAKFAAFLITGNVLNVLGQFVPAIVALVLSDVVGVYLTYIISLLSFIPTPILIVLFLKPVRKQMCHLLCRKFQKDKDSAPVQETNLQSASL